ncbi:MAG TPA: FecR domain-containing protein [Rhodopila sp.]|jgi:transmembrane sensor|nr:FecR domain-containing protein [Rhodopila sp.]
MRRKSADEIDAEAADWAARFDRGLPSADDEQHFQAWLSEDDRRLGAFGRMRAIALSSHKARALGAGFDPAIFAPAPEPAPSRRLVLGMGGSVAAAALIGAAAGWRYLTRNSYRTAKGEMRVFALEDGSVVTLNTQSRIAVDFSEQTRGIRLIEGEVLFDVAKNPVRPFVVAAGDTEVRVVGTSFTIRCIEAMPVQVLVREGIVDVRRTDIAGAKPIRISANTRAVTPLDGGALAALPVAPIELRRELAWQDGRISLEGQSLAVAVAEFSRYSDTRIVVDDPSLAREEIAGLFNANNPVGFAQTIAMSLNVHTRIEEGVVHISR